jgi:hypothetical protein
VGGLTHLRGQAVHHALVASNFADRVAELYYDHFGSWVWYAGARGGGEIAAMYQSHVANREVMATLNSVMQFALNDLPNLFGS